MTGTKRRANAQRTARRAMRLVVVNRIGIEPKRQVTDGVSRPVFLSRSRHGAPITLHVPVAAAAPDRERAQPARDDVPSSQAGADRDPAPGGAAVMHRAISFENTIDDGSNRIADDQETGTMLSPHEFSMLLRVARAPDSVDPSNPAFAVLVEKRLVDDTQVRMNAVAARPALTPIGQMLLARFDEAA